ncbi:MAG: hypothetical protein FWE69_07665, partial [Clostridiales bacterium]|nr:hypothetical protein [Clostridiales bacterium]
MSEEVRGKKALSLCLLRVLEQHASPASPLTTKTLIERMKSEHGLEVERKAVGRNLALLDEMGFALSTYQQNGKGYYLLPCAPETPAPPKPAAPAGDTTDILLDGMLRAPAFPASASILAQLQAETPIHPIPE